MYRAIGDFYFYYKIDYKKQYISLLFPYFFNGLFKHFVYHTATACFSRNIFVFFSEQHKKKGTSRSRCLSPLYLNYLKSEANAY